MVHSSCLFFVFNAKKIAIKHEYAKKLSLTFAQRNEKQIALYYEGTYISKEDEQNITNNNDENM